MERQTVQKVQKTPARDSQLQSQSARSSSGAHPFLEQLRSIGNQAVQRLTNSPYIQTKLQVSTPGDPYEQEADRVADNVMRMSEPTVSRQVVGQPLSSQIKPLAQLETDQADKDKEIVAPKSKSRIPVAVREDDEEEKPRVQRACDECEQEKKQDQGESAEMVHRECAPKQPADDDNVEEQQVQSSGAQIATPKVTTSVAANIHAMNGGGRPLPATTRAFFEPRFGADFSQVRVHTDPRAAETAKSINARAFTVARDIAFGGGQFAPESQDGRRLLAHELTHVVQQDGEQLQRVQMQAKEGAATGGAPSGREKGPLNFPSTAAPGGLTSAPPIVHEVLSSTGQPLGTTERAFFERRFGRDFSDVRVHTDSIAAKSATAVNALAYTAGKDIVFAKGQYAPHSTAGERLLAHELVHTLQQRNGVLSAQTPSCIQRAPDDRASIMDTVSEPAGGCGLCYGKGIGKVGPRDAGIAAHKAIQNELAPQGVEDELAWGKGRVDLAVVRPISKQVAIAEIKPANELGIDDGIKQIEERLRVLPKLKAYAGYEWVGLYHPVAQRIRFSTEAPICDEQPGYCYSQDLSVAGPVKGLLYLYFCEPSYSELLSLGCDCDCEKLKKKREEKKREKNKEKEKESGPGDTLPEQLLKLGGELAVVLATAGLLDIGLALAGVLGTFVSSPLVALAAVVLGIAFFWDKLKSLGSKIAELAQSVWDKITGLAEWVRGGFTWILGKLNELGIKLAELGSWLAGMIERLAEKLAEGVKWVAGKIAAGGRWVGRKIASAAEAFWDWLWGSDVEPMVPIIEMPITEEIPEHCAMVAHEDTIVRLDADLLFPFGKSEFKPEAYDPDGPLAKAAAKLGPLLQKDDRIIIEGYTDVIGSEEFNQVLSEQRAGAVAKWFVEHGVVRMSRIQIEGYGKTRAQAKANDEEGRKKDRRVDIWLPKHGSTKKVCW